MDSTRSLEMRIGLLVVAGLAALVVLILATDRISWTDHYEVVAYMEDAGGLNVGSPVKLAGITIGSVVEISPSDDSRGEIAARLRIDERFTVYRSSELKNQAAGIFGDNILTFSSPRGPMREPLPKDGSAEVETTDTFITQAQTQAESILAGLAQVLGDESVGEMRAVVRGAGALTNNGAELMVQLQRQAEQLHGTLVSLELLAEDLRVTQARVGTRFESVMVGVERAVDSLAADGSALAADVERVSDRLETMLTASTQLAEHGNALMAGSSDELVATITDLRALAADLRAIAAGAAGGRGVVGQLLTSDALARDLNATVITTAQLAERVADNPDVLFWGTTPEEREEARRAREARQVRRSFMEGFEYRDQPAVLPPPPPPVPAAGD